MTNNMCLPGATFIFKKPTDLLIKKYNLEVTVEKTKKRRPEWMPAAKNSITVNGITYPMSWFNCKVMYFGPSFKKKTSPIMEGASYIIFDKLRVTNKANIAALIGRVVDLPYILLSPQQRILDLTKLPNAVQYNLIRGMETEEILPASKYEPIEDTTEFIRFIRKNAPSRPSLTTPEHLIEVLLIQMVSSNISRHQNIICDLGSLQCGCGYNFTIDKMLLNIQNKTTKKGRYSFYTLACPRCRINYRLTTTPGGGPIFKAKRKGVERTLERRIRVHFNIF